MCDGTAAAQTLVSAAADGSRACSRGALQVHGFERFDKDNSGRLSEREFHLAAEAAGYGEVAEELFAALPREGGVLNYRELIDNHTNLVSRALKQDHEKDSEDGARRRSTNMMRDLSLAMQACSGNSVTAHSELLSTTELQRSGFVLQADDVDTLRTELRKLLRWHTLTLAEFVALLDPDHRRPMASQNQLSYERFARGFTKVLGFRGDSSVLRAAFSRADRDGATVLIRLNEAVKRNPQGLGPRLAPRLR